VQYLAILKIKPNTPKESLGPHIKPEAAKAWEMLAAGVIRSLYYIPGEHGPVGAVLLLEVGTPSEADALLKQLPFVEHGLVGIEVIPLAPFTGFASLFTAG
jgi:muconolactone delta-isomerase